MSRRAPSSDERVLAELAWVGALARTLVRDPGIADDVVQEAWLLARERPPRTDSARGLRAWLAQVTRTLVRSRLRSERARGRREEASCRRDASVPPADEVVARTELQQRVVAAVMALAEPYRSAVLLRHADGLTAREIGLRQGVSADNARQRIARGLALLRAALDHEHGGDGRTWVLALGPFLRPENPLALTPSLLGSSLVMKSTTTLLASLAAVLIGVVAVSRFLPGSPHVAAVPGLDGPGTAAPDAEAQARLDGVFTSAAEAERVPLAAEPVTAPSAPRLVVRARLVDGRGAPLAGAELAVLDRGRRSATLHARAAADGGVELALADELPRIADPSGDLVGFLAHAPHCRETLRFEPAPVGNPVGVIVELGEVQLFPIGALGGRVRAASGLPFPGAEVRLTLPVPPGDAGARLFGPRYTLQERRGHADAEGRFLFEDVEAGSWCPWAGAPGMAWTRGVPLRVEPAGAAAEIELVLEPLPETSLIRGMVRDAGGAPLAAIEVLAVPAGASDAAGWALTDDAGEFVLAAAPGVQHRVSAREPRGRKGDERRHGPASIGGVRAGEPPLVLVLPAARWIEVVIAARGGAAVTGAMVELEQADASGERHYPTGDGDRARVLVPDEPFTLAARAEGFAPAWSGPLDPLAAPAELRIELVPLARVRGVVRAAGEPVAGARVQLMRLAGGANVDYLYGFPARLDGFELQGAVSDARGRFELPIPFTGECALFAEKDGFAAAERSPLVLDPARDESLDLELDAGGAVEGRVLVPAGESPAGILVRLCRGDMRVHEAVTDSAGRYRAERLTPGAFMVLAERKRTGRTRGPFASPIESVTRERFEFPWALTVRGGQTTEHDVDLAAQELGTLAGTVSVDGAPPAFATVRLVKAGEPWSVRPFDAAEQALGADGAFAFESLRTESYRLVFEGLLGDARVVQTLELADGRNDVGLALASASLRGRLPSGERGPFAIVTDLDGGALAVTPVPSDAGTFALPLVPAGASARLVGWRAGAERDDPLTWPERASFALPRGQWTELE